MLTVGPLLSRNAGERPLFNPVPQLSGFFLAITFMSLPLVAVTMTPLGSAILLKIGKLIGALGEEEDTFAEVRARTR